MRVVICSSDDYETIARLLRTICSLGGRTDGEEWAIGVGLHRFQLPEGEISVFVDAWIVDVAGHDELIHRLLEALSGQNE
ncbi:MAG TPA: hypothetical protein VG122_00475 [Gemmata sp.]|jgi:hypothetical protein|nr:hypothetical protein [Gemmata sp.]